MGLTFSTNKGGEGFPLLMIMGLSGNLDWWPDQLADALAAHYRVIMRFNSFDRLSEITALVLVLAGGEDILIPAGNSEILVANIPGAKLKVYPKCGHGFIDQVWEQVYRDLMNFLTLNIIYYCVSKATFAIGCVLVPL